MIGAYLRSDRCYEYPDQAFIANAVDPQLIISSYYCCSLPFQYSLPVIWSLKSSTRPMNLQSSSYACQIPLFEASIQANFLPRGSAQKTSCRIAKVLTQMILGLPDEGVITQVLSCWLRY